MKLCCSFIQCRKHNFQISMRSRTSAKFASPAVKLSFLWYSDAGFRLIFLQTDLLNSLPNKFTSESFWQTFVISFLAGKQRYKFGRWCCRPHCGILNSLSCYVDDILTTLIIKCPTLTPPILLI